MSEVLRTIARSTFWGTAMICGVFAAIAFCVLPIVIGAVVGSAIAGEGGLLVGGFAGVVLCIGLAMGLLDGLVTAEVAYDRHRREKEAER